MISAFAFANPGYHADAPTGYTGPIILTGPEITYSAATGYHTSTRNSGDWGSLGLCTAYKLAAGMSGGIGFTYVDNGTSSQHTQAFILGFSNTNARGGYSSMPEAAFDPGSGTLLRIQNGNPSSTGLSIATGDRVVLWRDMAVQQYRITVTKADGSDGGSSVLDPQFIPNDLFLVCDMCSYGRGYNVRGYNLTPL